MYGNNPYFQPKYTNMNMGQQFGQQMPQFIPQQPQIQNIQPITQQPVITGLQGKVVESVDVVKTIEIPFDGSISYFPLVNGSSIFTKQLQADGTIKNIEYRPVITQEKENDNNFINYVTIDDLNNAISNIDLSSLNDIKEQMQDIKNEIMSMKQNKEKEIEIDKFPKNQKRKNGE